MSAYQIAIRFAQAYPENEIVRQLPIGGRGVGENQSVAQRIAHFLSQAIRNGRAEGIEGAFISHDCDAELSFFDSRDRITASGSTAHSIFRLCHVESESEPPTSRSFCH